eukprot:SAG22_NODE_692_length_7878_cov_6.834812_2_plen_49_part_00
MHAWLLRPPAWTQEGDGFKVVLGAMNAERVLIAAECIGDGRFFVDRAR